MAKAKDRRCRKCGENIPWRIVIDNKVKHLVNRKYCLKCSPWGKHNTKKDIDSPSKKRLPYAQWPEKWKKTLQLSNYRRSQKRKNQLVKMSGGKCLICGYNKCVDALIFHHRNPEEKLFGMDLATLAQKKWETVEKEWEKCDLLCSNCHVELHYSLKHNQ